MSDEYLRNPFIDMELDPNAECKPEYLVLQSTKEVEKKKLKKIEKFKFVMVKTSYNQQDHVFLRLIIDDQKTIAVLTPEENVSKNAVEIMKQFSNRLLESGYDASTLENELEDFLKLTRLSLIGNQNSFEYARNPDEDFVQAIFPDGSTIKWSKN